MPSAAYPQSHAEVYDAHPFYGRPCADSHPSRLAVVARLAGIQPAPVENCRVLELGCGDGSNLIAIAESLPDATCVGIDLSARHIELGQAEVRALGLGNLTLHCGDLLNLPADVLGASKFDYIIADCFYSWVPRSAQDRMFALAAAQLAPHGVLFVSYNLLPGWRMTQVLRDFLSFDTRTLATPAERIAQSLAAIDLLPLITEGAKSDVARFFGAYTQDLGRHLGRLGIWREQALIHDIIADVNTPVYLSTFVNHAGRFGLRYLEDAAPRRGLPSHLSAEAVQRLSQHVASALDLEQYLDFAEMRMYRQSLLCSADLPSRKTSDGAELAQLHISSFAEAAALSSTHPWTNAALQILAQAAPNAMSWPALCAATQAPSSDEELEQLATNLVRAFAAEERLVGLHAFAPRIATTPGSRPRARGFARRQLLRGDEVTNLYHRSVTLDPLCRKLVPLLDGQREVQDLVAALAETQQLNLPALTDEVNAQLSALCRLALLVP